MISNKKIAVLGGDARQIALAEYFAARGMHVRCFGLPESADKRVQCVQSVQKAVEGVALAVLPLPASPDGKYLNMPLMQEMEAPLLSDLLDTVPQGTVVAGGKLAPSFKALAAERGVRTVDYFESEELQRKNALPTAEGAVSVLMREIPRTVCGLEIGITGFGRVAEALAGLLLAMGAKVTVIARRQEALEKAAGMGCETVLLRGDRGMIDFARQHTVIFNTVPFWLFSAAVLENMSPKALIVDLASAPGGVDANAAALHGIKVIWALSLPGKYAPITAGEIIAETVWEQMRKEGIL